MAYPLPARMEHRRFSSRINPRVHVRQRWGEDELYIQNRKDNLTCFRNNFDSIYEIRMDQRTMAKEQYMHMIPKPMSEDLIKLPRKECRYVGRHSTNSLSNCQVFPILDASRKTKEDNYVISGNTRAAIQQINNKRYSVTNYTTMFGDDELKSNLSSYINFHRGENEFGFLQKSENYNLPEIKHTIIDYDADSGKTHKQRQGYLDAVIGSAAGISENKVKPNETRKNVKFAASSEYVQLQPISLIGAKTLQTFRPDEMCNDKSEPEQDGQYRYLLNNDCTLWRESEFDKVTQQEGYNSSKQNKPDFESNFVLDAFDKGILSTNSEKIQNRNYCFDEGDHLPKLDERNCENISNGPVLKCNICQESCLEDEKGGLRCTKCQLQESKHALIHYNRFNQKTFSGKDTIPGVASFKNNYNVSDDKDSSFSTLSYVPTCTLEHSLNSTNTEDNDEQYRCRYFDQRDERTKLYNYHGQEFSHACTVPANQSNVCTNFSKAIKRDSCYQRPHSGVAALPKVQDSNAKCPWLDNATMTPSVDTKLNISKRVQTIPKKTVCFSRDLVKEKPNSHVTKGLVNTMGSRIGDIQVEYIAELPNYRPKLLDPPFSKSELQKRFHEDFIDPIPDLRDSHIYAKRIKLCDYNTCVFRGYNPRLTRLVPPLR